MKIDYLETFRNRVIYITGVGRSGTTIIGQIFASMRPAYYLFEPAILRPPISKDRDTLRRNVFEDYFLNQIHGRYNFNPRDWTYWKNFISYYELSEKWNTIQRRDDALKLAETAIWVIKNPEAQPLFDIIRTIFPGVRFVNVIRNGIDVVASSIRRGWFTDDYQSIDDTSLCGSPWYIWATDKLWKQWKPATRAACGWIELMKKSDKNDTIRYEDFCKEPTRCVTNWGERFELKLSPVTWDLIYKVQQWKPRKEPEQFDLNEIEESVRHKFINTMNEWGYEI